MSDALDDLPSDNPLGWLRDYVSRSERDPAIRDLALNRLRALAAAKEERALYIEGYDEATMGPKHGQPTARQWLHRYIAGDYTGPKSVNDHAHAKVEEAIADARAEGRREEVASVRGPATIEGWTGVDSEVWREDATGTIVAVLPPRDRLQREVIAYVAPQHERVVFDMLVDRPLRKQSLLTKALRLRVERLSGPSIDAYQCFVDNVAAAVGLPKGESMIAIESEVMARMTGWSAEHEARSAEHDRKVCDLTDELARLRAVIHTPHTDDWMVGVPLEAAHQIERWGTSHDAGKAPQDWFWLLGYLGGKALHAAIQGDVEKAKHHTISAGAAMLNWHRALTGETTVMRPGIKPPE